MDGGIVYHGSFRPLAVLGVAALLVAASGVGASPVLARSTKPTVLLQDPLTKPSKAVRVSRAASNGGRNSWTFMNHQFVGQDFSPGDWHFFSPVFKNQGTTGLANVTIDVQAALLPNTQSGAGIECRNLSATHFYRVELFGSGQYVVEKGTDAGLQPLASGSVQVVTTNHIRLTCAGPAQPGPTATVTFTGAINDQTFSAHDSSSPYPGAFLSLVVGATGSGTGGAAFNNLKITQTG